MRRARLATESQFPIMPLAVIAVELAGEDTRMYYDSGHNKQARDHANFVEMKSLEADFKQRMIIEKENFAGESAWVKRMQKKLIVPLLLLIVKSLCALKSFVCRAEKDWFLKAAENTIMKIASFVMRPAAWLLRLEIIKAVTFERATDGMAMWPNIAKLRNAYYKGALVRQSECIILIASKIITIQRTYLSCLIRALTRNFTLKWLDATYRNVTGFFLLTFLLLGFGSAAKAQCIKYNDIVKLGGQPVITAGLTSSTTAIKTFKGATVDVYNTGTLVHTSLFSNSTCSIVKSNPFTASSVDASYSFYVNAATVDLRFSGSGSGIASPFTVSGVTIGVGTPSPCNVQTPGTVVITCAPYSADSTGVTANIATAINQAVTDGYLNIYVPIGTYTISQAQITANFKLVDLFGHNNIHIFGDGWGKTIISFPSSATLFSSANTTIIAATGDDIEINGITFVGPSTATGTHGLIVIACEGLRPKIHDNEFRNWNTATGFTTGASPITTYYPNTNLDVNTTLGTTIVAGLRTVTPASMANIYVNRLLTISGTTENVVVTDVTATTFTATFANTHSSANTVTASASAKEYALVYNNWIHDCPNSQGMVVNSSGNIFKNNRVIRVGITGLEHGFYVQAGHNVFDGNWVEGVYGYSFHQHTASNAGIDESGNVYINNTSLNPNTAHFQVDTFTSNGSDPIMPNAVPTERFVTIGPGNLFKNTAIGSGGIGISGGADGVTVIGNTFEDAGGFSNFWVRVLNYGVVVNNTFRSIQSGLSSAAYIVQGYDNAINVTVSGNEFVGVTSASGGACIGANLNINASIIGNKFKNVTGSLFSIDGSDKTVIAQNQGNSLTLRPFAATFSSVTNLKVYENNISTTASTITTDPPPDNAVYHDNTWNVPLFQTSSVLTNGVQVWNDSGGLGGTMENGRAFFLPTGSTNGAIAAASLVTLTATGKATSTGTGDTQFVGIAGYSLAANSPRNGLFLGQPGTIFAGLTTDGSWTAGHTFIISVTTAGTVHDTGAATPPAWPVSYGVFLDSGVGVGAARVLIVKTL